MILKKGTVVRCVKDFHMTEDNKVAFSVGSSYTIDRVEDFDTSSGRTMNNYWMIDDQGQSHGMELPDMDEYFEVN